MRNFLHGDMEFPYLRTPKYYSLGNSLKFSRSPLVHRSVCTVTYQTILGTTCHAKVDSKQPIKKLCITNEGNEAYKGHNFYACCRSWIDIDQSD